MIKLFRIQKRDTGGLFDWLELIEQMRDEGMTQQEIGDVFGWSKSKVADFSSLINNMFAQVLEKAKTRQVGRASEKIAIANFTEGWFRNSGIYKLNDSYQSQLMNWFIDERKGKQSNNQVKQKVSELLEIQEQVEYVEEKLQLPDKKEDLLLAVSSGEYTNERLREVIERYNDGAKNKAIFGVDSLTELRKLESNS